MDHLVIYPGSNVILYGVYSGMERKQVEIHLNSYGWIEDGLEGRESRFVDPRGNELSVVWDKTGVHADTITWSSGRRIDFGTDKT